MQLLLYRGLLLVSALAVAAVAVPVPPSASVRGRQHLFPGDDALLTCIVHHRGGGTVLWRRGGGGGEANNTSSSSEEVLTAAGTRVSSDTRLQVLHDSEGGARDDGVSGGEVYVLVINNVNVWDSGMYVCEVNSRPPVRAFHQLTVIATSLEAPLHLPASASGAPDTAGPDHDFTPCCRRRAVSDHCLQLCTLAGISNSNSSSLEEYDRCQSDFANIYSCMTDGRSHLGCCLAQGVPASCGYLCHGEAAPQNISLRSYLACREHISTIAGCVAFGLERLPAAPGRLQVEAASLTELRVSWVPSLGHVTAPPADWFTVNVTRLRSFDGDKMALLPGNDTLLPDNNTEPMPTPAGTAEAEDDAVQLFNVSGSERSLSVPSLRPLTMYEITVSAHGSSSAGAPSGGARSAPVRAVTWLAETRPGASPPPPLPDVRACCVARNVTEPRCLRRLCEPSRAAVTDVTDLMVCAPWTGATLSCMADGRDHSACCRARGLPPLCVQMCAGTVQQVNYRYFPCLEYMSSYASCLMQGYGVVPSAPLVPRVALTDAEFAVVRWNGPELLADTVRGYTVQVRELDASSSSNGSYTALEGQHSPCLLDGLTAGRQYEFYVTAVNEHGEGAESSRVLFQTLAQSVPEALEAEVSDSDLPENSTVCCSRAGVLPECQTFCSHTTLAQRAPLPAQCTADWSQMLGCLAEGRPWPGQMNGAGRPRVGLCCPAEMPAGCVTVCDGGPPSDECRVSAGWLLLCLSGREDTRPPPVTGIRVTSVTADSVTLVWEQQDNVQRYQVHYGKLESVGDFIHSPHRLHQVLNVSGAAEAEVHGLTRNTLYGFAVSYAGWDGTMSRMSSGVIASTSEADPGPAAEGSGGSAPVSVPLGVTITAVTDSALNVTWQPPADYGLLRYRVYYRAENDTSPHVQDVDVTNFQLTRLTASTAYRVYVTAVAETGVESGHSETVEAWTDDPPRVPPTVQLPRIEPDEVTEGEKMTVTCTATGTPTPTVQLYINGRQHNQSRTHELVTSVARVTRQMTEAECVVDVGGSYLHAVRIITVRRAPRLTVPRAALEASVGASVTLRCSVDAVPEPTLTWSGPRAQEHITPGDRHSLRRDQRGPNGPYMMELVIDRLAAEDFGEYSCHAQNAIGARSEPITLKRRQEPEHLYRLGVSECCRRMNISEPCRAACSHEHVQLDAVLATPGCVAEFSKLMVCAADGSDHRDCCSARGVPDPCLTWCEGRPGTQHRTDCVVTHAADVIGCFQEGKELIPGRPRNVVVKMLNATEAIVRWDPPSRNGDKVVIYRLRWWPRNATSSAHLDTPRTAHRLSGLEPGLVYRVAVTAANRDGTSLETTSEFGGHTPPSDAAATAHIESGDGGGGTALVAALVISALVAALVLAVVWLVRRRRLLRSGGPHVSFANPTYLREATPQEPAAITVTGKSDGDGGASVGRLHSSASDGWHEAALETPLAVRP